VQQVATALTWIEGAKCLGAGEAPVLPVETMYLRLDSLLRQGFPTEIAETITTMKTELSDALEAKAAMLNDDC